jgi:hypothetical protein
MSVRVAAVNAFFVDGLRRMNINGHVQINNASYLYVSVASYTADTVGDVRMRASAGSLIIENCTVANAAKGGGTWVAQSLGALFRKDVFNATAGQTVFTLSRTPVAGTSFAAYRNSILLADNAFTFSGTSATYVPANNGGNALLAGDVITITYSA